MADTQAPRRPWLLGLKRKLTLAGVLAAVLLAAFFLGAAWSGRESEPVITSDLLGQQLQAAAANFQQKIQQNAYTREQAEAIQAGLQKQNNDLQGLQQRLSNEFAAEQEKYNKALHDSIANYLARYNKDKKYSIIFSKSGDNLLYADKAYDITKEVISGLNKAYKGKLKKEEAAPAKK